MHTLYGIAALIVALWLVVYKRRTAFQQREVHRVADEQAMKMHAENVVYKDYIKRTLCEQGLTTDQIATIMRRLEDVADDEYVRLYASSNDGL